jgi:2-amino-4-hydroxy-6-hydroxymethyldihydropteridine diphosphokinase
VAKKTEMAQAFIGVGSNIDRDHNIRAGVRALQTQFSNVIISTVYETNAIGFEGDSFFNLVVSLMTDLEPRQLQDQLHVIESKFKRKRSGGPRYASRTLDLDLLLYDDFVSDEAGMEIPREDVTRFAFVLCPLAEIAGELKHPVSDRRYADLWEDFEQANQELHAVKLEF